MTAPQTRSASKAQDAMNHTAVVILCVLALLPLMFMLFTSLKDPAQFYANLWAIPSPIRWENYQFAVSATFPYITNSILVSTISSVLVTAVSLLAAYAFVFFRFPGKKPLFASILVLMMLPGILVLVPLFLVTRNLGLMNSYTGIILPQVAGNLVIGIFIFHAYLEDFPKSLIEAARIEGASELSVLGRIILPLCKPAASTVVILTVLSTWNNYIWPLVVVRDEALRTIPLGLAFAQTEFDLQHNPSVLMACYAVASIPLLLCFLVFLRTFLAGLTAGAVKE